MGRDEDVEWLCVMRWEYAWLGLAYTVVGGYMEAKTENVLGKYERIVTGNGATGRSAWMFSTRIY